MASNIVKSGRALNVLAAARVERRQATQVAIYRKGLKSIITTCEADQVEATIQRLENLNPGKQYEIR